MAITAGSGLNKVPSAQQQALASNYIDSQTVLPAGNNNTCLT